jgi:DNA-binding response OmpR family regulator
MPSRILLIEDDARLAAMLRDYLGKAGLEVSVSGTGREGLAGARAGNVDAVVLDLTLPDQDGLEVCRALRAHSDLPLLMLTARGDEEDRIVGLELGADDYLAKPFNPRELLARLRAVMRRRPGSTQRRPLRFGRLEIDRDARVARVAGEERALTSHQFDLLCALAESAGRVVSRERLMEKVRGGPVEAFDRSIDVHISRIRAAIEDDPAHPRRILTVRGAGYVFARAQDEESGS